MVNEFKVVCKLCSIAVVDISESRADVCVEPAGAAWNDLETMDSVTVCVAVQSMVTTKFL